MSWREKLRAFAELGRISNLPTCITNVLVGCAIGAAGGPLPWSTVGITVIAIAALYVAGMALNDAVDVPYDRKERPDRPIPSGRVSLVQAWLFIVPLIVLGLGLLAFVRPVAALFGVPLVLAILGYDFFHKTHPTSVFLMGLCRALVYWVAAASVAYPFDFVVATWMAIALGLYITFLTLVARAEGGDRIDRRRWLAIVMPVVALSPVALYPRITLDTWVAVAGVLLVLWLGRAARFVFAKPPATIKTILTWLSGICLLDAFFLALLDQPTLTLLAWFCAAFTTWGHRKIMGT